MSGASGAIAHERVEIARGPRSGLTMIVALHSSRLGPALGGCRLWHYPSWREALDDALRLSEGMTAKNALADIGSGGGKAVIRLEPGDTLDGERRRDAFLDLAELVARFDGRYITAEDVGTSSRDMAVIHEVTPHVVGLPTETGGVGDPGAFTARGVEHAILATLRRLGPGGVAGTRFAIAGLGQVGGALARTLAAAGAELVVTDVNEARRELAVELGAIWVEPDAVHRERVDVLVPAGVGGMLTPEVVEALDCRAIVGPANNQLAEPGADARLAERGILYAPDFVVNAGGVIHLAARNAGEAERSVLARIDRIGETLERIFEVAERDATTPLQAAETIVAELLAAGPRS
ncbi:Glu/Leu/Phe/Val family dehydrogenase [Homoserinibacter sp. YIM 151385]|uniref:Glu/Leu/Phe/Val family dehydrogenase n=1 Tax=Homoserinibacter sp. YIM 151385 TaxID=2985506 RepID=UPI0022F12DF8|nr:Glu/Leu/Phe/Val dehydrogenase dimerization domain-containing protein [Homoserinibacter sp. YIM 151385]WBU37892.1 Glu/Leu/Phe/Val dehydrogenase family protein [Homoserinibacter sp. YIM 151385]